MKGIKGVLLDLDHTLYNYKTCNEPAKRALFAEASKRFRKTEGQVEKAYFHARKLVKANISTHGASHSRLLYIQRMIELLTGETSAKDSLDLHELFWDVFFANMKLYKGVEDFLGLLKKKGIKVALVTDLTADIQLRKIVHLGLDRYIDFVVSSEEAGSEKPMPFVFMLALHKLELSKKEVIMVGDSYAKDVEGAENIGIKALLFESENFEEFLKHEFFATLKDT